MNVPLPSCTGCGACGQAETFRSDGYWMSPPMLSLFIPALSAWQCGTLTCQHTWHTVAGPWHGQWLGTYLPMDQVSVIFCFLVCILRESRALLRGCGCISVKPVPMESDDARSERLTLGHQRRALICIINRPYVTWPRREWNGTGFDEIWAFEWNLTTLGSPRR